MPDTFYDLVDPDVKKIRAIFRWGHQHALRTDIDKLDCTVSFRREPTDKPFSETVKLITSKAVGYFRIVILGGYAHTRGVVENGQVVSDLMELFIRSLQVGEIEYFIFMYLRADRLEDLMKKYPLRRL